MNKTAISVQNLTVSYNAFKILDNISFEIYKNDLIFIIGGNGSGKSTLIKTIMGLKKEDKGIIKILGQNHSQKLVAEHISYLPQYTNLERNFPITVEEIIELECSSKKSCPVGATGHLKDLQAEELINKRLDELSGGEFQKVLIARTLIRNSDILIFDEPTNNLDYKTHQIFKSILEKQLSQNKTIIIITHNIDEIKLSKNRHKILEIKNRKVYERNF